MSGIRLAIRCPSIGALFSMALHGAAAGALIARPELLGTVSQGASPASTGIVVTAVIDAVMDEPRPDANAGGAAAAAPLPVAAATAAASPPPAPSVAAPAPEVTAPDPDVPATVASQTALMAPTTETKKPEVQAEPASAQLPPVAATSSAAVASVVNSTAPASVSASHGDMIKYANKVRSRLAAHRPAGVDQRGKVIVTFTVSGSGAIDQLEVQSTSGFPRLDRMALASVRSAAPFPTPPSAATLQQRTFAIPFEFR